MEVKLHKGPKHGKVIAVPEGQTEIYMNVVKAGRDFFREMMLPSSEATLDIRTVSYRMKVMSHPKYGTFPCVDPDGRVFFEYVS